MTIRTNIATQPARNAWRDGVRAVAGFRIFGSNQQISKETLCNGLSCEGAYGYLPMHKLKAHPGGAV